MSNEPVISHADWLAQAEAELYAALQALQDNDLPFVRSSAARAQDFVLQAWRSRGNTKQEATS